MSGGPDEPQTPEQWRDALWLAQAFRMIADCKMYGLIAGGPKINVERCDAMIERGKRLGIHVAAPSAEDLAAFIHAGNSQGWQCDPGDSATSPADA